MHQFRHITFANMYKPNFCQKMTVSAHAVIVGNTRIVFIKFLIVSNNDAHLVLLLQDNELMLLLKHLIKTVLSECFCWSSFAFCLVLLYRHLQLILLQVLPIHRLVFIKLSSFPLIQCSIIPVKSICLYSPVAAIDLLQV